MPYVDHIDFNNIPHDIHSVVDDTLSIMGIPADAKAVGDAIAEIEQSTGKVIKIREFSGDSYGKYTDKFSCLADATLFNKCFAYGTACFSIDVKANKLYAIIYPGNNSATTRTTKFRDNRFESGTTGAIELDEDGNVGDVVTDFAAVYNTWVFNPTNTNGYLWDTGTYDQWGSRQYANFPVTINETTYYWRGIAFVPNRDFHGIVGLSDSTFYNNSNYCFLFEINDSEWNPYLDGGLEKGYTLYGEKELPEETKQAVIRDAVQAYAENFNCLYEKKWACCGDSLTQYSSGQGNIDNPDDLGFMTQIMRRTGVIGTSLGRAGARWSSSTDGTFETGSAVERVNTIINGSTDYDIITFAFGTNADTDGDGTINDAPAYDGTMCAAIKWCIESLIAWKPTISIGIILPPQRADMGTSGNNSMKTKGNLIRQIAELYSVPCCDMWSESGINTMHYTSSSTGNEVYYYLSDMLHLSDNGKMMYAKKLRPFLESIAPIY